MTDVQANRFVARFSSDAADVEAAQRLRHRSFRGAKKEGAAPERSCLDQDSFDDIYKHVLIEDHLSNQLVACFRLLHFPKSTGVNDSYSAQFYDLSKL